MHRQMAHAMRVEGVALIEPRNLVHVQTRMVEFFVVKAGGEE
jgi:hypothetical protein